MCSQVAGRESTNLNFDSPYGGRVQGSSTFAISNSSSWLAFGVAPNCVMKQHNNVLFFLTVGSVSASIIHVVSSCQKTPLCNFKFSNFIFFKFLVSHGPNNIQMHLDTGDFYSFLRSVCVCCWSLRRDNDFLTSWAKLLSFGGRRNFLFFFSYKFVSWRLNSWVSDFILKPFCFSCFSCFSCKQSGYVDHHRPVKFHLRFSKRKTQNQIF